MITKQDLDHHLKRERQERERAESATDPSARRSHLDLAESHARRAANARMRLDQLSAKFSPEIGELASRPEPFG
jgi:hypothetical protein